jgi:hypothetical protein
VSSARVPDVILDEPEPKKVTAAVVVEAGRFRFRLFIRHRAGCPVATPDEARAVADALVAELLRARS